MQAVREDISIALIITIVSRLLLLLLLLHLELRILGGNPSPQGMVGFVRSVLLRADNMAPIVPVSCRKHSANYDDTAGPRCAPACLIVRAVNIPRIWQV